MAGAALKTRPGSPSRLIVLAARVIIYLLIVIVVIVNLIAIMITLTTIVIFIVVTFRDKNFAKLLHSCKFESLNRLRARHPPLWYFLPFLCCFSPHCFPLLELYCNLETTLRQVADPRLRLLCPKLICTKSRPKL